MSEQVRIVDEPQIMSLAQFRSLIWSRKIVVAAVTLLVSGLGTLWAFTMKPVYQASVLMMPATLDANRSGLAGLIGQIGGIGALPGMSTLETGSAAEYLALIQSPQFVRAFLQDNALLPIFFAGQWDGAQSQWRTTDSRTPPTLEDGYRLFVHKIMTVERERDTGLVTLSMQWTDPQLAANWANMLVNTANEQLRDRAITEAQTNIEYLRAELDKEAVIEVRSAIYKLIENQLNAMMVANGRKQYAFRILSAALAPDPDHFVRPKRKLMMGLSLFMGLVCGCGIAVMLPLENSRGKIACKNRNKHVS